MSVKNAVDNLTLGPLPPADMITPSDTPVPYGWAVGRIKRGEITAAPEAAPMTVERRQAPAAEATDDDTPTAKSE